MPYNTAVLADVHGGVRLMVAQNKGDKGGSRSVCICIYRACPLLWPPEIEKNGIRLRSHVDLQAHPSLCA
eukprot:355798-Chlamydomonas_euryale.AAC.2